MFVKSRHGGFQMKAQQYLDQNSQGYTFCIHISFEHKFSGKKKNQYIALEYTDFQICVNSSHT